MESYRPTYLTRVRVCFAKNHTIFLKPDWWRKEDGTVLLHTEKQG